MWDPVAAFQGSDRSTFPLVPAGGDRIADAMLHGKPVEMHLKMVPLQVHWHVPAEHARKGELVWCLAVPVPLL